jgi:hypothetical protein
MGLGTSLFRIRTSVLQSFTTKWIMRKQRPHVLQAKTRALMHL